MAASRRFDSRGVFVGPLRVIVAAIRPKLSEADARAAINSTKKMLEFHERKSKEERNHEFLRIVTHRTPFGRDKEPWVIWIAKNSPLYQTAVNISRAVPDEIVEIYLALFLRAVIPLSSGPMSTAGRKDERYPERTPEYLQERIRALAFEAQSGRFNIHLELSDEEKTSLPRGLWMQPKDAIARIHTLATMGLEAQTLYANVENFDHEVAAAPPVVYRNDAISKLHDFLVCDTSGQFLVLLGSPGTTKSTLIAHFLKSFVPKDVSAIVPFFIRWNDITRNDSLFVWRSFAASLQILMGDVLSDRPPDRAATALHHFKMAMAIFRQKMALTERHTYPHHITFVIDGLDELDPKAQPLVDALLSIARSLPDRIRFILSCRPKSGRIEQFIRDLQTGGHRVTVVDLDSGEQQSLALTQYFQTTFKSLGKHAPSKDQLDLLVRRSERSFLYATLVASDIKRDPDHYDYSKAPQGLDEHLDTKEWRRLNDGALGPSCTSKLLATIGALRGPCSLEMISEFVELEMADVEQFFGAYGYLFATDIGPNGTYQRATVVSGYQHYELSRYFLERKLARTTLRRAHLSIITAFNKWWNNLKHRQSSDADYYFRHIVAHFIDGEAISTLLKLMTQSPDWLQAQELATKGHAHGLRDLAAARNALADKDDIATIRHRFQIKAAQCSLEQRNETLDDACVEILVRLGSEAKAIGIARARTTCAAKVTTFATIIRALRAQDKNSTEVQIEAQVICKCLSMRRATDRIAWARLMDVVHVLDERSAPLVQLLGLANETADALVVARLIVKAAADTGYESAFQLAQKLRDDYHLYDAATAALAFVAGRADSTRKSLRLMHSLRTDDWLVHAVKWLTAYYIANRRFDDVARVVQFCIARASLKGNACDYQDQTHVLYRAIHSMVRRLIRLSEFDHAISLVVLAYTGMNRFKLGNGHQNKFIPRHYISDALQTVADRASQTKKILAQFDLALIAAYAGYPAQSAAILRDILVPGIPKAIIGVPRSRNLAELVEIGAISGELQFVKDAFDAWGLDGYATLFGFVEAASLLEKMGRFEEAKKCVNRCELSLNEIDYGTLARHSNALIAACIHMKRWKDAEVLLSNMPRCMESEKISFRECIAETTYAESGPDAVLQMTELMAPGPERNVSLLTILRNCSQEVQIRMAPSILRLVHDGDTSCHLSAYTLINLALTLTHLGYEAQALTLVQKVADPFVRATGVVSVAECMANLKKSESALGICRHTIASFGFLGLNERAMLRFAIANAMERAGFDKEADKCILELKTEIQGMSDTGEKMMAMQPLHKYEMSKRLSNREANRSLFESLSEYLPMTISIASILGRDDLSPENFEDMSPHVDNCFVNESYFRFTEKLLQVVLSTDDLQRRWASICAMADTWEKISELGCLAVDWVIHGDRTEAGKIYNEAVAAIERWASFGGEGLVARHIVRFLCIAMVRDGFSDLADRVVGILSPRHEGITVLQDIVGWAKLSHGDFRGALLDVGSLLGNRTVPILSYGAPAIERIEKGLFLTVLMDVLKIESWSNSSAAQFLEILRTIRS